MWRHSWHLGQICIVLFWPEWNDQRHAVGCFSTRVLQVDRIEFLKASAQSWFVMNQWLYSEADNQSCLPEGASLLLSPLVTRDFHVYGNYSACWWLLVGPLGVCIPVQFHPPLHQSNSITLATQREADGREEDIHRQIHLKCILNRICDGHLLTGCQGRNCVCPHVSLKK